MAKSKKVPLDMSESLFYRKSIQPVPVDVWMACLQVYQAAAMMTMPVTNPEQYKFGWDGAIYALTDNRTNRGAMAIREFLGEEQKEFLPSILSRVITFGGLIQELRAKRQFGKFFKEDASDGAYIVAEALLEAFAVAPFLPRRLEFDLRELHKIASKRLSEEDDS